MSINCGIVGLPNVGKSTIFKALTSAPAEAANYPFCTIDPNIGIVDVADSRINEISNLIVPEKVIPTSIEFVDIAGLVKGASKGEGLGNQFLGHIRQVNAIIHVVRCFEGANVIHVNGEIGPLDDIGIINIELALADLEVIQKKQKNLSKLIKGQNKEIASNAKMLIPIFERLVPHLEEGHPGRTLDLSNKEKELLDDLNLITLKKVLYLCNLDEESLNEGNQYVDEVMNHAQKENSEVLKICGKLEAEIASLDTDEEKKEFMELANISSSGLSLLTHAAYQMLGLKTYFTAGEKEVRAWTFKAGAKAPEAAGVIHTDFERGFIKAEIYHCDDLFKLETELKVKEAGKLRIEGKDYEVQDGDVIHFRFNV